MSFYFVNFYEYISFFTGDLKKAIPPEVKNTPISSDDNDNWEFISTQTTKELFEQSQQHRKLDTSRETTINNSVVELIDNKEVWNYGFERLNDLFKNTRLRNALKKFTIDFYLKKVQYVI